MAFDYSTINITELKKLTTYRLAPTYQLQDDPGNGCYMDPPGYPTYFTRSIYTQHGNHPARSPQEIIPWEGVYYVTRPSWMESAGRENEWYETLMRKLWVPLPLDNRRTRLWILHVYQHWAHCYQDLGRPEYGRPGTLVYPVPEYKLKRPVLDPHWTEEYKQAVIMEAEKFNHMELTRAETLAVAGNHMAYIRIHSFYPEYEPELHLIQDPPTVHQADWWERLAEQPTPETCKPPRWMGRHNEEYCRWCGRETADEHVRG